MAKDNGNGAGCPKLYWVRPSGEDNTPSKRSHRCCSLKHGFMLKHWKCTGRASPDCPLNAEARKDMTSTR